MRSNFWAVVLHLIFVTTITLYFYVFHNIPFLNCESEICNEGLKNAAVADSYRYVTELYNTYIDHNLVEIIVESRIFLFLQGSTTMPNNNVFLVYYLSKLGNNLHIYYFLNLIIYYFLIIQITKYLNQKQTLYFILFLTLNIYIFGSFSIPNKEIFGYLAILSLVGYLSSKKIYFLIFALIFSLLSRIVLTYFLLCIAFYLNSFYVFKYIMVKYFEKYIGNLNDEISNLKTYYLYSLIGLAILLFFSHVIYVRVNGSSYILYSFNKENVFSLNIFLHELSLKGFSFITIWIKILENLFGGVFSSEPLLSTENYLNRYSEYIHLCLLSLFVFLFFKKRYALINENIFIKVTFVYTYFLLIFSMQSFIMHRYVAYSYPLLVYILVILIVFNKENYFKSHNDKSLLNSLNNDY